MGLKSPELPVCDNCGEVWLPKKGPARDDPRAHDAEQRALPDGKPLRCGKCKSLNWDINFVGDRRKKRVSSPAVEPEEAPKPKVRCKHGLLNCEKCS